MTGLVGGLIGNSTPNLFRGLLTAPFHFVKSTVHNDELFSRIEGIAAIRYSNYSRKNNQEFVPIGGHAPRLFKSLPLVHAVTFICFLLCIIAVTAFFWALVQGLPLLALLFGIFTLVSGVLLGKTLEYLDRITLNI